MSNSRHLPGCACQTENGPDFEMRVLAAGAAGITSTLAQRVALQLCLRSESYVSITMITMLVVGMACKPVTVADLIAGTAKLGVVDEDLFESVLSKLVEDVRLRRAEIDAVSGAAANKGARQ